MITLLNGQFQVPGSWTYRVKGAPDRKYVPKTRSWLVPNTRPNRRFLLSNFKIPQDFNPEALAAATAASEQSSVAGSVPPAAWPPDLLDHQVNGLNKAFGRPAYFFAHGMGSGKSRTLLELWREYFHQDLIDEGWVVCPNPLIDNWVEQINLWAPELITKIEIYGVLSLSVGSLPTQLVKRSHGRLAVAIDESQRIKNSQARRTKVMQEIGKHARFRANLTGTNITKGIEDLYSQYYFLDPNILGYKSFYAFRNKFCVMGGFDNRQIVGYKEVNELMELIAPYTDVVADPVKLPPQTQEIRVTPLSAEQKRLLQELKSQMQTEMAGTKLSVDNALAYYTRGAQIVGGFFPLGEGKVVRLESNAKLDELMEIMAGTDHKVVIFCRFVAEANLIMEAMRKAGIEARQIKAKDPDLMKQVNEFRTDPGVRTIVSTYAMGALGYTLIEGKVLVEYSGTFNFEDAVQARKRIHRIGQEDQTKVIRLMANCKLDKAMKDIADRKQDISDFVNNALMSGPLKLLEM